MVRNPKKKTRGRVTGRRRLIRYVFGAVLSVGIVGLGGLAYLAFGDSDAVEGILIEQVPDAAYEHLFPYYVDLAVTSQFRLHSGVRGGPAGHALMYIKGACKDAAAPFPQLRRCMSVATELDDPEHGVGVSVNRFLKNVNWLAIPGYKLFYAGNVEQGERLTQAHFDATVRTAVDAGIFTGVELHDFTPEKTIEEFAGVRTIGTDLALSFARTTFVARLPVTEPMLDEIIAFLNDKNREYATGEADYNWSGIYDNCVHTVRNALAAANIWAPISVRETKLWHLLNMAVPANEVINLGVLGAEGPIEDYRQIQEDGPLRDALHEFDWLPTRHGALLKTLPVQEPNDLYDTSFRLFALQSPFSRGKRKTAIRLLSDERFFDLRANLNHFRDKYEAVLSSHYEGFDGLASVRGTTYRRVQRKHYAYIKAQRAEVEAMLERLDELELVTEEPVLH